MLAILLLLFAQTQSDFTAKLERAQEDMAAGQYEASEQQLRALAERNPSSAEAWYMLGRARIALARQSNGALLSKVPPASAFALAIEAEGLMHKQQYRRAFPIWRATLAKDSGLLSARAAIALIYRLLDHPDWAAKETEQIATADCSAHKLACDWAAGRHEAVLAATRDDPSPAALYWRGQTYSVLAYQAFGELESLPPSVELYRFKAGIDWDAGRVLQMVEELRKAVALAPRNRELRLDLCRALGAASLHDEAYGLARELLREKPDSAALNALAGDALLGAQKADEAIPFLRKSAAASPSNLVTQASLGRAYMQAGAAAAALPHLEAAGPIDTDGTLHFLLARAYRQTGRPGRAAQAMTAYQRLSAKAAEPSALPDITPP